MHSNFLLHDVNVGQSIGCRCLSWTIAASCFVCEPIAHDETRDGKSGLFASQWLILNFAVLREHRIPGDDQRSPDTETRVLHLALPLQVIKHQMLFVLLQQYSSHHTREAQQSHPRISAMEVKCTS